VWLWRVAGWANIILREHSLPDHYFAYGDAEKSCKVLRDDAGELAFCEDAIQATLNGRNIILVSCDTNRYEWNTVMGPLNRPDSRGTLWVVDYLNGERLQKIELAGYAHPDFHPLGLALYDNTLFVVNHRKARSTIEVFEFEETASSFTARHVRTVSGWWLLSPNGISPTSASSFYITQDHLFTRRLPFPLSPILTTLETMLMLPLGWVNHVTLSTDPATPVTVAWSAFGIPFPNGVAISDSGTQVAVSSSSRGLLVMFNRDPATNQLVRETSLQLPFGPDNVGFDAGKFIVGGHPNLPKLKAVARRDPGVSSGSWVATVEQRVGPRDAVADDLHAPRSADSLMRQDDKYVVRTVYQSSGQGGGLKTSTGGVLDEENGKFFAPGLYADGLLVCQFRAGL